VQLQQVTGYRPLAAGMALLPVTVVMLLLSARSGGLAARIGPRLQMSVGPVVVGVGLAMTSRIGADGGYVAHVLPAVAVFGLGLAITVAPLTATALASVPDEHSGTASAVNNDVARVAGLIAVAVLPSVAGITGAAYLHPHVFSHGFEVAMLIAAGLCGVGGLLAAATIRNPPAKPSERACSSCGLEAPPAAVSVGAVSVGAAGTVRR
jgi:MFS family permease